MSEEKGPSEKATLALVQPHLLPERESEGGEKEDEELQKRLTGNGSLNECLERKSDAE